MARDAIAGSSPASFLVGIAQHALQHRLETGKLFHDIERRIVQADPGAAVPVLREQLVGEFLTVPEYRQELASSHNNLGNLLIGLGQDAPALEQSRYAASLRH